jgi:signal transduction histidine kinase
MNSDIKERVVLHSLICMVSVLLILATGADIDVIIPTSTSSLTSNENPATESRQASDPLTPLAQLFPYPISAFVETLPPHLMTVTGFTQTDLFSPDSGTTGVPAASFQEVDERVSPPASQSIFQYFISREGDFLPLAINLVGTRVAPLALLSLLADGWRWGLIALILLLAGCAMITFEQYRAARMRELSEALCESNVLAEQLTIQQAELGKAYRTLALDYAVIRALNESPTPQEAAQHILQTICVSIGWDIGTICDVDTQSARTSCIGVWQKALTDALEFTASNPENNFTCPTALLNRVVASRQPQWINDLRSPINFSQPAIASATQIQSGFGLPILSGNDLIGVLEFYSYEVQQPDPELAQILATIASHIGQLIQRRRAEEALSKSQNDHLFELQRVRRRIANDLHDDVGSSLTKIALISETVRQKVAATNPDASERLMTLTTISNELVETMSDIVWAINPRNDQLSTLSQRMRRYASDIFSAQQIRFRFQTPDSEAVLGANLRREVFLIFKESVNNVVKHSQCSEVVFGLAVKEGKLSFNISDNGKGIDPQIVKADTGYLTSQLKGGNGLSNMRRRARELGGQFEVMTSRGRGTTVSVKLPFVYGLSVGK